MLNEVSSFLLIGQSNMAGRGYIKDVKQIYDEQIRMLVNGRWQTMTEPINFDRPTSGVSLAASFAGAWRLENPGRQIGLIPCAEGGSSLDDWAVGGPLFENAVFNAKLAMRISTLEGILWHQGENDSFGGRFKQYNDKLQVIITALRDELQVPEIPLILGGLGDFLADGRYGKYFTEFRTVNGKLLEFASTQPNTFFVTASGLTANPDGLHFNAVSLRKFGIRYFKAFQYRQNIEAATADENELIDTIANRELTKTEKINLLEISFASGTISLENCEAQLALLNAG
ncbi:protein of unknown function [Pedobacter westerhofensis]|uniref:Sialate O-acetylesterase domain-containing protein n=1 Tax=Pedobacter westerhofensis TaxID=425512 RepID=A0A521FR30_9SPHI|nr:sialate O-acetylesterase [Pedobacter westerhofensis]SMO98648.1 protein of unknown function [Pedobacter westerhofensis]